MTAEKIHVTRIHPQCTFPPHSPSHTHAPFHNSNEKVTAKSTSRLVRLFTRFPEVFPHPQPQEQQTTHHVQGWKSWLIVTLVLSPGSLSPPFSQSPKKLKHSLPTHQTTWSSIHLSLHRVTDSPTPLCCDLNQCTTQTVRAIPPVRSDPGHKPLVAIIRSLHPC